MKFKSKMFLDEGQATRVALCLRARPSERDRLFKALSPEAKRILKQIQSERKKRKQPIWGY